MPTKGQRRRALLGKARGRKSRGRTNGASQPGGRALGSSTASALAILRVPSQVHRYKRWVKSSSITTFGSSASAGASIALNNAGLTVCTMAATQTQHYFSVALASTLADIPGLSAFTAMYDRYRIAAVRAHWIPLNNVSASAVPTGSPSNGNMTALVHSAVDYADNAAPTASDAGIDLLRARPSYQVHNCSLSRELVYTWVPRVALAAYGSGVFTSYASVPPPWIETASAGVAHYGYKFVVEVMNPDAGANYFAFKLELEYALEFCDPT